MLQEALPTLKALQERIQRNIQPKGSSQMAKQTQAPQRPKISGNDEPLSANQ